MLACSALKKSYRNVLQGRTGGPDVTDISSLCVFVLLDGPVEVLVERMVARSHFMPTQLLHSQLETLEKPTTDEQFIACDITQPVETIVEQLYQKLNKS